MTAGPVIPKRNLRYAGMRDTRERKVKSDRRLKVKKGSFTKRIDMVWTLDVKIDPELGVCEPFKQEPHVGDVIVLICLVMYIIFTNHGCNFKV